MEHLLLHVAGFEISDLRHEFHEFARKGVITIKIGAVGLVPNRAISVELQSDIPDNC